MNQAAVAVNSHGGPGRPCPIWEGAGRRAFARYISRQAMVRRLPPYLDSFCWIASPE